MDLEDIMLSVISQTDKDKYQKTNIVLSHLYVKSRKTNKQMKQNKNKLMDTENKMVVVGGGMRWGRNR